MRLATIRLDGRTVAVRIDDDQAVELDAQNVETLLIRDDWRSVAEQGSPRRHPVSDLDPAPVVSVPRAIICVGLNYRTHILEMGRELPAHPTLFAKLPQAVIGARDPIQMPSDSTALDWEGELAVIVGATVCDADERQAEQAIAGYAVFNDVTVRDYQYRTTQWFQGKTFEGTSPLGPYLVTPDEFDAAAQLRTEVDGEVVQNARVDDLLFGPAELVAYVSRIVTLRPGDIIATGTPAGVGQAANPPRYLTPGMTLTTTITGLGSAINTVQPKGTHS